MTAEMLGVGGRWLCNLGVVQTSWKLCLPSSHQERRDSSELVHGRATEVHGSGVCPIALCPLEEMAIKATL